MFVTALALVAMCIAAPAQADFSGHNDNCAHVMRGHAKSAKKEQFVYDIPAGQAEATFDVPQGSGLKSAAYAAVCDDKAPEIEMDGLVKVTVRRRGELTNTASLTVDVFSE